MRVSITLTILVAGVLWRQAAGVDEERLPGWRGETYDPRGEIKSRGGPGGEEPQYPSMTFSEEIHGKPWIQLVSWKPRAAIFHNFLSDRECKHIIDLAKGQMQRSEVVGEDNRTIDDIRTSYGTFLRRNYDPIIAAIEQRVAIWTHLPVSHQEDLQVLRYGPTHKYGAHLDGEERTATVLMYLVEPEEGGETTFVNSEWIHPEIGKALDPGFSNCAKSHVAMKPKRGDALLFWDRLPDCIKEDIYTEHTACPVIRGVKWNAVKWIHGEVYDPPSWEEALAGWATPRPEAGICADFEANCEMWAKAGECERNPGYMRGVAGGAGNCRKACKACTVCAEGDAACLGENRRRSGYLNFDEAELKFPPGM